MKKFTLTITIIALGIMVSFAQSTEKSGKKNTPVLMEDSRPATALPNFLFEKESHNFGNITEGTQAHYEFKFINNGTKPLVITNVASSCDCATPTWSNAPVAPGQTGVITVLYDSKGRPGSFNKTLTVTSNSEGTTKILTIVGTVTAKPAETPRN